MLIRIEVKPCTQTNTCSQRCLQYKNRITCSCYENYIDVMGDSGFICTSKRKYRPEAILLHLIEKFRLTIHLIKICIFYCGNFPLQFTTKICWLTRPRTRSK